MADTQVLLTQTAHETRSFEASAGGTLPTNGEVQRHSKAGGYFRLLIIVVPIAITAVLIGALLLFLTNWIQIAIIGIPVALLLYLVASQINLRWLRPITELSEQTRRLSDGDLSHLVVLRDPGLGAEPSPAMRVASDVNHLVRELRKARENERNFQDGIARATDQKAAADELRLSYDNLIVVSELGQQIIASLRLEDIARVTYDTLNRMMDASSLELATFDRESQQLHVILSIDQNVSNAAYSVPLDSPSSFEAWAAVHGREVFLEDVEANYVRYVRRLEASRPGVASHSERIRSLICVPMFTKGTVVGVMAVGSYRKHAFTSYHLDMMKSLGLYIAVALDNAESYQKLDRALTELKNAQRQLVQAEKMSSLGLLTAGIAHEINNPINFVSANINPLRRNLEDVLQILRHYQHLHSGNPRADEVEAIHKQEAALDLNYVVTEISNLLDGIQEGATRTAEIVQGLRNFSRTDEQAIKLADVRQGIDSTLTLLHNKYKNTIEIIKDYEEIPEIECFLGQLNQVFMNILSNAIHAIGEHGSGTGTILIRTAPTGNDSVEIRFRDTGTGMTEDVRKKIFDPFFTTKDVGVGTGLGLSISYGIIEKHGGTIDVQSAPGKGTEFIITLPIHQRYSE